MIVLPLLIFFAKITSIFSECNEIRDSDVTNSEIEEIKRAVTKVKDFSILGGKEEFEVPCYKDEFDATAEELLRKLGFELEERSVLTDGHTLTLHRINNKNPGSVVFLMHGLYGSSEDWILTGKNGLAYYLADEGFDVWMGNTRRNKPYREYETVQFNCKENWRFTWDEVGRADLSAAIDYVLQTTGHKKMIFIGYSQGSTSAAVLLSSFEEFNRKIALFVAIAPITFVSNTKSPLLKILSLHNKENYIIRKAIGFHEFAPSETLTRSLSTVLCDNGTITQYVCKNFMFQFCGFNIENLDIPNLPLILSRYPSKGSTRSLIHYAQGLTSGQFRRYDFEYSENINIYGSMLPPEYNLENITTPVILFYSDNDDWISNKKDVEMLMEKLPNVISSNVIDGYSHLDFMFAKDVKTKVYLKLFVLIKKYKKYWR